MPPTTPTTEKPQWWRPLDPPPLAHKQRRAARMLNVSTKTISRWVKRGKLTPVEVEGIQLIPHEQLVALLRK